MLVTLSGMVTEVRESQPEKAEPHITFVEALMSTEVIDLSFASMSTKYGFSSFPR